MQDGQESYPEGVDAKVGPRVTATSAELPRNLLRVGASGLVLFVVRASGLVLIVVRASGLVFCVFVVVRASSLEVRA